MRALKSIVSRKSSTLSRACSMASGSDRASNIEGSEGGGGGEDENTDN